MRGPGGEEPAEQGIQHPAGVRQGLPGGYATCRVSVCWPGACDSSVRDLCREHSLRAGESVSPNGVNVARTTPRLDHAALHALCHQVATQP